MEKEADKNNQKPEEDKVNFILSHSYVVFLLAVILGVVVDIIFPIDFFSGKNFENIGLIMIALGSLLAYWAQSTSRNKNKIFYQGPYKYLRNPTHFGLFVMTLGLAFVINSPFSVLFTVLAQIVTKIFFLKKREKILEDKHGEEYKEYKRKVKNYI